VRLAAVIALIAAAALAAVPPVHAAQPDWTVVGIEQELMCVVCHQRLDQSNSAFADGMRKTLRQWHAQGLSKNQVLDRMVAQFGEEVLAAPPKKGFNLLAWVVPGVVLLAGGAIALALALMWGRSRPPGGAAGGGGDVDAEMDARIDRELADDE
jgi:cytochrome c-type biogenesis protein CcmH